MPSRQSVDTAPLFTGLTGFAGLSGFAAFAGLPGFTGQARCKAAGPGGKVPVAAPAAARTALVLSGGCLHGLAQIGVLKALAAAGIRPDLVVGCSVGAVIGALYAAGRTPAEIERAALEVVIAQLKCWALSWRGLWHASGVEALMRRQLPCHRIEAFPIRFTAVATDAATGAPAVLAEGDASHAVTASAAMPGFFVPARFAGRRYRDGCLVSPLPVRIARALGAERVIAVNTLVDPARERAGGLLATLLYSPRLMMRRLAEHEAAGADLVIAPVLPARAPASARERQALIDAGEREGDRALRGLLARW